MKKIMSFAYTSAIALLSVGFFAACSSSDDTTLDPNPTYNTETKSVTTKFVLNVSSASNMRQASATVQKANNFRGMKDATLIGLSTGKGSSYLAPFLGSSTGFEVKKTYDLGTLYASGSVDNDPNSDNANSSSHRVVELTLPLKTDAMLVYGRAIPITKTVSSSSVIDKDENGFVVYDVKDTPEETTFSLVSRMSESEATVYAQCCDLAATVLNRIMKSEVGEYGMTNPITRTNTTTGGSYTQEATLPALTWRGIGSLDDDAIALLAPLQENLAKAYSVIRKTYSNAAAINSGSAASLCNMMKDVYAIAKSVSLATATNDDELNAQRLADEIIGRIENYFNADDTAFPFKAVGKISSTNTILYSLNAANIDVSGFNLLVEDTKYFPTFPKSFNVPEGVAQLDFTDYTATGGGFAYKTAETSVSLLDLTTAVDPTRYTYPSELLYFDNSLLRVTDTDKNPGDYPDGYSNWDANDSWSGWTTGPVTSGTRSVAVKNNINYGVAMLQTTVAIDGSEFKDNHPAEEHVTLSAEQIGKFVLTGVLIGGQYKQVGWNYLSNSYADANKNFIIYDTKMASNGATVAASTATPNYTMVFDNYCVATGGGNQADQTDVLVALEFKNGNDVDIYGKGGIIPKGGTFYLAAKLKLQSNTISDWPTTYAIPPYTDAGASKEITRIFTQDYVTTATFKIGEHSLENAYTTVPDLRASQTSLGMSVDLQWRPGLSFETTLGQTE